MKTYILKASVNNSDTFPLGTIVTITDDYWGKGNDDFNTGFTVVEGELKGKKGCVAHGLDGWLFEDTVKNRELVESFKSEHDKLQLASDHLNEEYENIPTATLH